MKCLSLRKWRLRRWKIIDEAPENNYWDSFYSRTLNRILSRNVTPYQPHEKNKKGFRLRIGSYSLAVVSIAAVIMVAINYFPDGSEMPLNSNLTPAVSIGVPQAEIVPSKPEIKKHIAVVPAEENLSGTDAAQNQVQAYDMKSLPENASSTQNKLEPAIENAVLGVDFTSYFKGELLAEKADLRLTDGSYYSSAQTETNYDKIDDNYRLSSSMIADGILQGANGLSGNDYSTGLLFSADDIFGGNFGNWGYLSMPSDTGNSKEIRRFLIELELIETK